MRDDGGGGAVKALLEVKMLGLLDEALIGIGPHGWYR